MGRFWQTRWLQNEANFSHVAFGLTRRREDAEKARREHRRRSKLESAESAENCGASRVAVVFGRMSLEESRVDTRIDREWEGNSLRAAGPRSERPRTFRRACRPPNGSESSFDDLGPLNGGHIVADSLLILCYQVGRQSPLSAHHPMLRVRTRDLLPDPVALLSQPYGL